MTYRNLTLAFVLATYIAHDAGAVLAAEAERTAAGLPAEGKLDAFQGEPRMEMQQVFKGGRFPNVVVATDGTVLAFWDGVKVRRSEDGGKSWGEEILVGKGFMGGGVTVDENSGDILAFVETKHPPQASLTVYRSTDHGKTWKVQETEIRPNKDGNIPTMHMNEHGITLRHGKHKGRLLRPTRWYDGGNDRSFYPKHYTDAIYSDDGGKTWHTSDPFPAQGAGEAAVAELSDGRIYYNARRHWDPKGDLRCRWTAWSDDDGASWQDCGPCRILPDGERRSDYGLMGGLVRLPVEGRDILVFSNIESASGRSHGTVWASLDGGKTWPFKRLVDAGPFAYSSLDAGRPGTPSEGWIYLQFERGDAGAVVARFNLSWLLEDGTPSETPFLARWTFDEADGAECDDTSGNGWLASCAAPAALGREAGVFGNALTLSGAHRLAVRNGPDFKDVGQLSFSVWVKPKSFQQYNEIFRKEDGDWRVLFSFQENGRNLSLGLNVNGYVECDAPIRPEQLLDGRWHHCAAVFDGQTMRVYLDGKEIGSLDRPGLVTAGGAAAGCIGSSEGNECFQGAMDDLRIYREALPTEMITALAQRDAEAEARYRQRQARRAEEVTRVLARFLGEDRSFAATLAAAKLALRDANKEGVAMSAASVETAVCDTIAKKFPEEIRQFRRLTGGRVAQYLADADNSTCVAAIERLLGPMTESMPLTPDQWRGLSEADRRKWAPISAIRDDFERLASLGEAARFSPEWVETLLGADKAYGPTVEQRPLQSEAVAPWVAPTTPETRTLSADEARAIQQRDWLHQAEGNVGPGRIKAEIGWAREIAARIKIDAAAELRELAEIEEKAARLAQPDEQLYFRVREIKRRIMFRNPAVDFDSVLFVDAPYPQGSEWTHETRHRLGYMAVPGGRLLKLRGLSPAGDLWQLMPQKPLHGAFWRPDLSHDGKKVLFCFHPHNEKSFHLYEIGIDGSGLRQITSGPYDDLDPIYLPDGKHILFSSTRGNTYVRCMPPTNAFVLTRCDSEGKSIYLISSNNEPDYLPSVMDDGRVIYTRWEYTDKPLWRAQKLWTMNPDGTQNGMFWGNQSVWPDLIKDARCIPGSQRVMFTGSAHHNWFDGSVGIIDPKKGYNFPDGIAKVTADVGWPEVGNGPVDPIESPKYHSSGGYGAYYSPYPLGEKDFLVSANRAGKFMLYLMDVDGNRELIYEGRHHILHAMPVKPRPQPPVIPDAVRWPAAADRLTPQDGVLFSTNVYQGVPEKLVGKAKFLRILTIDHKTYTYWNQRPYLSTGPVVSGVQSEGVKRVLGTVPVEEDGSMAFQAPAGVPLHFQLLDGQYRALQTMRSFTSVMPGERRGCVGCHEVSGVAPPMSGPHPLALKREPGAIAPPPWGKDTVSYARYVRPLLDRYCVDCHQKDARAKEAVDLTVRPGHLGFDQTYWLFTGNPTWGAPYKPPDNPPPGFGYADMLMVEGYDTRDPAAYRTPEPMTKLSYASRLVELASSGRHHDVRVDDLSRQKLIAWVDAMCPYLGDEEIRQIEDPHFPGIDWLSVRPRVKTAPRIVRPGPLDASEEQEGCVDATPVP